MLKTILIVALIVTISILLLSVRLFFGKKFVHTHIDGNNNMAQHDIYCVQKMDRMERHKKHKGVEEKRCKKRPTNC